MVLFIQLQLFIFIFGFLIDNCKPPWAFTLAEERCYKNLVNKWHWKGTIKQTFFYHVPAKLLMFPRLLIGIPVTMVSMDNWNSRYQDMHVFLKTWVGSHSSGLHLKGNGSIQWIQWAVSKKSDLIELYGTMGSHNWFQMDLVRILLYWEISHMYKHQWTLPLFYIFFSRIGT